jgi:hypothetical protein
MAGKSDPTPFEERPDPEPGTDREGFLRDLKKTSRRASESTQEEPPREPPERASRK